MKPIGFIPVYPPQPGSIVTQAFILCADCGAIVYHNSGPRNNTLCLACTLKLIEDQHE